MGRGEFIIPYALARMEFRRKDAGGFFLARFFRLYPPFFLAGALAIGLWFLATLVPGFRGEMPSLTFAQLFANASLSCDFLHEAWLIPIFWTLAIEAQYYILVTFSYPLLVADQGWLRTGVFVAWVSAPLVAGIGPTVFTWSAAFAMGFLCFLKKAERISGSVFWMGFLIAIASQMCVHGSASGIAVAGAGLAIAYLPELRSRLLIWIGTISYSLYLLHIIVGGKVINLAERLPENPLFRIGAVFVALLTSLAVAWAFCHLIEKPSHQFGQFVRTRLGRRRKGICAKMQPDVPLEPPGERP
jgi:peptidoglycan/LPS O-acetylase OafA/YrhL